MPPRDDLSVCGGASPAARITAAVRWVRPVNQGAANRAATNTPTARSIACQAGQCVDEVCTGNDCALACQVDLFCGPGRHCDRRQGRCRDGLPGGLCVACNQMVAGQCGTGLCLGTPTRRACTGDRDCAQPENTATVLTAASVIVSAHQDRPARAPTLRKTKPVAAAAAPARTSAVRRRASPRPATARSASPAKRCGRSWRRRGDRDLLPTRRWSSVSVAPLHVVRRGDGPPLILLHGFFSDHRLWAPVVDALAASHHCVSVDLPGHGRSATWRGAWADLLDQLDALVEAYSAPVSVVGYSLGARVLGQLLQRRRPPSTPPC